ncbi:hypothetical protein BX666DRAFT_521222 [Dichotomocladium elegans]|nr:hypothetical protein BX666DRAFT_521222 [Dichotomocladium elegans]
MFSILVSSRSMSGVAVVLGVCVGISDGFAISSGGSLLSLSSDRSTFVDSVNVGWDDGASARTAISFGCSLSLLLLSLMSNKSYTRVVLSMLPKKSRSGFEIEYQEQSQPRSLDQKTYPARSGSKRTRSEKPRAIRL